MVHAIRSKTNECHASAIVCVLHSADLGVIVQPAVFWLDRSRR